MASFDQFRCTQRYHSDTLIFYRSRQNRSEYRVSTSIVKLSPIGRIAKSSFVRIGNFTSIVSAVSPAIYVMFYALLQ
jgi:hypothetical protein